MSDLEELAWWARSIEHRHHSGLYQNERDALLKISTLLDKLAKSGCGLSGLQEK